MGGIFISYRREETLGTTGRLFDDLVEHFGDDQVLRDIDRIPPGTQFAQWIAEAVGSCQALIAVIGPQWVTTADAQGRRRIDDPKDFVRLEIAAALSRDVPVFPVLVEGAHLPARKDLPRALAKLVNFQALEVADPHWKPGVKRLIESLEIILKETETAEPAPAEAAAPAPAASAPAAVAPTPPPVQQVQYQPVAVTPAAARPHAAAMPPGPSEVLRTFEAPAVEIPHLMQALTDWFRAQGYEVQTVTSPEWEGIQVRQPQGWRLVLGMSAALHVLAQRHESQLTIRIGGSKWADKVAVGAVGVAIGIGAITPIIGAWQQKKLPEKVLMFINQYIMGITGAPPMVQPASPGAPLAPAGVSPPMGQVSPPMGQVWPPLGTAAPPLGEAAPVPAVPPMPEAPAMGVTPEAPAPIVTPEAPAPVEPEPPVEAPPVLSLADQIRQLAALRDEGLISPEEFEAKKKQLLGL